MAVQNSYLPSIEFRRSNEQAMRAAQGEYETENDVVDDGAGTDASPDQLAFQPSSARTSRNLASLVQRIRKADAVEADNLERLFAAQPDLVQQIGTVMRQYGLDPHNVADCYALWWLSAWHVANQRHDTPSKATFASVRDQARRAFAAASDFAGTGDADKQQYAEALMLQATVLNSALEQAKDQPQVLARLAQAAKRGAQASGLDLTTMTLTEEGFVPREGADASDVLGEDAPAMAHTEDQMGPAAYVAIGALATLALGGAFVAGRTAARRGG